MNIFFPSVGRKVELIRAYKDAASTIGVPLVIYGSDITNSAAALAFCDRTFLTSPFEDPEYVSELVEICKRNEIELLIPITDEDLYIVSSHREKFEIIGTKLLIPSREMVEVCKDKNKMAQFFKECKLFYPPVTNNVYDYNGTFPCFIKPRNKKTKCLGYKVETMAELRTFANEMDDYVIRPYIEGVEYTVDIFCDYDGKPVYITPRERLSVRASEVMKSRIDLDKRIIEEAKIVIEKFKPVGPMTIHLIREKTTNKDYFIKIIGHYSNGAAHSIIAGADSPKAAIYMLLGKKLQYRPFAARDRIGYSKYEDSVCTFGNGIYHIDKLDMLLDHSEGIKVVIFNLDNTLYPEIDYIQSGCKAVAEKACSIFRGAVYEQVYEELVEKTVAKKPAIQQLVKQFATGLSIKRQYDLTQMFINTYRQHNPKIGMTSETNELFDEIRRRGLQIGIITDGRGDIQRKKLEKLGLINDARISEIIITDELAGKTGNPSAFRMPNPIAFEIIRQRFAVPYHRMIFVSNNMAKDFEAPQRLGIRCLHYKNTESKYKASDAISTILSLKV
ncbi:FMN phosphatase YigB, HAD superfamily [Lachnospiraceae bacterium C7]|nr:FMN phosphatase YigB, HAD superfamily [Lachnospiraceae bacterium C7]